MKVGDKIRLTDEFVRTNSHLNWVQECIGKTMTISHIGGPIAVRENLYSFCSKWIEIVADSSDKPFINNNKLLTNLTLK